jgi:hypothetical protein
MPMNGIASIAADVPLAVPRGDLVNCPLRESITIPGDGTPDQHLLTA